MTVDWWRYAQSPDEQADEGHADRPGHDPQLVVSARRPAAQSSCREIALAIRDEVIDLEAAGAAVIQIDEAVLREGLPQCAGRDWQAYLDRAAECFPADGGRACATRPRSTPICAFRSSTTSCPSIGAMDADAISIETARSQMELLDAFADDAYPNEIGPGV